MDRADGFFWSCSEFEIARGVDCLESAAEGSPLGFCGEQQSVSTLKEWGSYPNLGSKVLSLCLKCLLRDWESTWCHPLLVVESFVEEHYGYESTCYKACGFEAVGLTVGYGRSSRDYYSAHARPKQLYLRTLDMRARALLSQARLPAARAKHELDRAGPCPFKAESLYSLLELFKTVRDERRGHGLRHRHLFVLASAVVAMPMVDWAVLPHNLWKLTRLEQAKAVQVFEPEGIAEAA
jgi:hypothetical protein